MATYTIQFSVADEHVDRISSALRKHFGKVYDDVTEEVINPETGAVSTVVNKIPRDMTGEEILARVRQMSIDNVKAIVMSVEANAAIEAARASIEDVSVS